MDRSRPNECSSPTVVSTPTFVRAASYPVATPDTVRTCIPSSRHAARGDMSHKPSCQQTATGLVLLRF
jgi:hypothetical protein